MYDIIILGAGPAGLMAARQLNCNFLVIDKKKKVGLPLRCGEGIRKNEFVELFGNKNYSFIRNTVSYQEVRYKNIVRTFKCEFIQVDRDRFEKWLARDINILLNCSCNDIILNKDYVEIITSKGNFKSKMLILASGSNYVLQKKLKMVTKKHISILGYGGIYKNYGLDPNKFYYFMDDKYLGYFWVFPKNKEIANIGFGSFNDQKNVKTNFNKLKKKFGFNNLKLIKDYAGLVYCSGPIEKTYSNRIIACGAGAGFVYAGIGEGIYYALETGKLAGEFAKECLAKNRFDITFLKRYETLWRKKIGKALKGGIIFGDLYALGFKYNQFDKLFKAPTEEELQDIILNGKFPTRALFAWNIARIFGYKYKYDLDLSKQKVPYWLKFIYKTIKFVRLVK